ncbi:MAG: GDP-L-fucose synthase [Bacteroidetes bacterium]|nr:MAG: GDP-L-fucose synthase [Bacteroidota bacterium]
MQSTSKIYVAGHTGLVGSTVTRALLEKGYDNLVLRTREELDLTDQKHVETFFAAELPEYVILAAAIVGGIFANNTYRADFIFNNLIIQSNVIYFAWKYGVRKLLFLGSTCIYPKEAPQPLKEDYLLTSLLEHTNEPYAIAKIAGLKMCESFNIQYKTNFISIMPTNLYGSGDNFDLERSHVLPALLRKFHLGKCLEAGNWASIRDDIRRNPVGNLSSDADEKTILEELAKHGILFNSAGSPDLITNDSLTNAPGINKVTVTVWGTGSPLREFMNSEDMADACIFILEKVDIKDITDLHSSGNKGKDYYPPHFINVGTGVEITIRDLAYKIKTITGFKGKIVFDSTKPDGTMRKVTDITALRKLGFTPKIDLDSGLLKMYNNYIS